MSKRVIWVTSRKLSSSATFFIYEVSEEVMAKFCQKPILHRKVWSARNADSTTGRVSNCRGSQITHRVEPFDGPSESWESCRLKQYSEHPEIQPIWDRKLKICSAAVLSRTEFSSDIDRQNSVTSKPFNRQSRMSNGWKTGRVAQVFGVQLWNKFPRGRSFLPFTYCCSLLYRIMYFVVELLLWG
jgi:hypothetical protein